LTTTVVTGGAGFVGANLIRALLKRGRKVIATGNSSGGIGANLRGLPLKVLPVDLRDYSQAREVFEGSDCVYHLAAWIGGIEHLHDSKGAELRTLQSNLAIDTNVIRACIEFNVSRFVYASSVSVYPINIQRGRNALFAEEDVAPINPEGGYGWAKLIGEIQLDLAESLKSGIARIFNIYGEYCKLGKTAHVVPSLIRKAINYPSEPFIVWGDGTQTRNFMYIHDCIEALLKLEEHASYPPLKVNLGNPDTVTIKQLAETIVSISGKNIKVTFDPTKPVGPLSRIPDIRRAEQTLGWKPTTPLRAGLERTYEWAEQFINSSK
jgi:nucleoside-diphosphate-sugar epimerase